MSGCVSNFAGRLVNFNGFIMLFMLITIYHYQFTRVNYMIAFGK